LASSQQFTHSNKKYQKVSKVTTSVLVQLITCVGESYLLRAMKEAVSHSRAQSRAMLCCRLSCCITS